MLKRYSFYLLATLLLGLLYLSYAGAPSTGSTGSPQASSGQVFVQSRKMALLR